MRPKKYNEVKKALEAAGFSPARQKGSHVVFKNKEGKSVTVPDHGGSDIAKGTMRSIARQAGHDPEELFGDQKKGGRERSPMELLNEGNPPPGSKVPESKPESRQSQNRHGGGRGRGQGRGD